MGTHGLLGGNRGTEPGIRLAEPMMRVSGVAARGCPVATAERVHRDGRACRWVAWAGRDGRRWRAASSIAGDVSVRVGGSGAARCMCVLCRAGGVRGVETRVKVCGSEVCARGRD